MSKLFISKSDYNLTLFNSFIIEISPLIFSFFNSLTSVHLPYNIDKLFNTNNNPDTINYSLLNEMVDNQFIC